MTTRILTHLTPARGVIGVLAVLFIAGCSTYEKSGDAGNTGEAVAETMLGAATEGWIRIVRGVNGTFCSASAIGNGNDPKVGPADDLTNLSVSCSRNKTDTVAELRQFLPSPHVCYSTLTELRKSRRDVVVVRDPTSDNPYHCLLGTITPNQFVSRSRYE